MKKNIKIFDYITNPKLEPSPGKKTRELHMKQGKQYQKLVRINIYPHFISIGFNHGLIPWINKKLNVKRTFKKDTLKGIKILSDFQIEKYYTIVN